jgi:molybdopterin-guanine dinucleotide biosynthesis protein A
MAATTAGYVLVGGRSSRFGSDKALAPWQGRPLALWVAEQVRAVAGSVILVGNPEKYAALGLPLIPDAVEGFGPLAGVAAALGHTRAAWNLIVACDMPHLTREFLAFLLSAARALPGDVLLPAGRRGRLEPLCAVYSSECAGPIAAAVSRGVHKMTDGLAGLRVRRLPFRAYTSFDRDGLLFANLNTRADLEAARLAG